MATRLTAIARWCVGVPEVIIVGMSYGKLAGWRRIGAERRQGSRNAAERPPYQIRREEVHGPPGIGPVSATYRPIPGDPDALVPYSPVRA